MVLYNFKKIQVVPNNTEFIDIVLTRTQRKTPTVIHGTYAISRIRSFYMRKVKFTQSTFHDKLTQILDDFPKIDDIHPFYAALINVLYDKDHYKLALGQLNTARSLIDNLSRDYVRMLKFGQNLFQCKQLKRAAMGRMCTIIRRQGTTLGYLEEVRKHLSRLPSIDPTTRTLLICGYPNVGKSSFMNKVTRADVQVEPYAFTTKSLFVGHLDYRYIRWQVIDTPGILDHPLEERNVIEMTAITAMAHLHCAVLYFIDLSEQCGFTLEQQLDLFDNIKPVFVNKPLIIVANKIDATPLEEVDPAIRKRIDDLVTVNKAMLVPMSNFTEEGVMKVKTFACDKLLAQRVANEHHRRKVTSIANRVTVTYPKARDGKKRDITIPARVRRRKEAAARLAAANPPALGEGPGAGIPNDRAIRHAKDDEDEDMGPTTLKDIERANGGAGVFRFDWRNHRLLKNEDWKFDILPEIMDGKNVMDFIDPAIDVKMAALERLEAADMEANRLRELAGDDESDEDADIKRLAGVIREKKRKMKNASRREKGKNRGVLARKVLSVDAEDMREHLESVGLVSEYAVEGGLERGRERSRKRRRVGEGVEVETTEEKRRSKSVRRSVSRAPSQGDGLKNEKQRGTTTKHARKAQRDFQKMGMKGEGDRFIGTKMPRHLYSGKRGIGKTDRR